MRGGLLRWCSSRRDLFDLSTILWTRDSLNCSPESRLMLIPRVLRGSQQQSRRPFKKIFSRWQVWVLMGSTLVLFSSLWPTWKPTSARSPTGCRPQGTWEFDNNNKVEAAGQAASDSRRTASGRSLVASRVPCRRGEASQDHERKKVPLCDVFQRVNFTPKETSSPLGPQTGACEQEGRRKTGPRSSVTRRPKDKVVKRQYLT